MENEKNNNAFRLGIFTPYLFEKFEEYCNPFELMMQTGFAGYDPDNLNKVDKLVTPEGKTVLLTPTDYRGGITKQMTEPPRGPLDLAIVGSSEPSEEVARSLANLGIVVARYSIFYGRSSRYTGKTPEQNGYALDIPKKVGIVKALLDDDESLTAIQSRDGTKIKKALDSLNERLTTPILITPFLEDVLKYNTELLQWRLYNSWGA